MWFNLHTHSTYCDGKSTLKEIIEHASALGLKSLGFSSHAPLPFDCKWCMPESRLEEYLQEISILKKSNELEIYSGLEVDYIPDIIGPRALAARLDYTIGSVHFVEGFRDGRRWEIDGSHSSFLEGLEKIFSGNFKEVAIRYFELTREMVTHSSPTIVGHLDKLKTQNIENKFFDEKELWYREQIELTLESIQQSGCIVEVNTRGVYQKKSATTYPSPWILELILQKKIPVTLSSDAHHYEDLINQFSATALVLKQIGFTTIQMMYNGQWRSFKFNENGIVR
jgi:histidinol-phosphatase (PHP family)